MRLLLFTNFFSFHKDLLLRIDLSFPTFLPIKKQSSLVFPRQDRCGFNFTQTRLLLYSSGAETRATFMSFELNSFPGTQGICPVTRYLLRPKNTGTTSLGGDEGIMHFFYNL